MSSKIRYLKQYLSIWKHYSLRTAWARFQHDYIFKFKKRPDKSNLIPRYLQIEISTFCNLKCVFCQRTINMKKVVRNMSIEEFKKILDQFKTLWMVQLQGFGEPLMNKDLPMMLEYCRKRRIMTSINTNLLLLKKAWAKILLDSGLSEIHVSLDTVNPDKYKELRVNGEFEEFKENLINLVKICKGRKHPWILLVIVLMKENIKELDEIVSFAEEIGVGDIIFQELREYSGGELKGLSSEDKKIVFERIKALKNSGVNIYTDFEVMSECMWPWRGIFVTADGYVTPCCEYEGTVPDNINFGNLFEENICDIWNNTKYQAFRKSLRLRNYHPICKDCINGGLTFK